MSVNAFATNFSPNPLDEKDKDSLVQLVGYYLDDVSSSGEITVGNRIPAYYINGSTVTNADTIEYYPVFDGNNILGIFTISIDNGKETYGFGKYFSKYLNEYGTNNDICIVFTEQKSILCTDTTDIIVESANLEELGQHTSLAVKPNRTLRTELTKKEIIPVNKLRAVTGKNTLYIDIQNQRANSNTTNLCWAFTVYHIGNFVTKDTSVTPVSIAKDKYGSTNYNKGVYVSDIPDIFLEEYGLDTTLKRSSLSFSKIKTNIFMSKHLYILIGRVKI